MCRNDSFHVLVFVYVSQSTVTGSFFSFCQHLSVNLGFFLLKNIFLLPLRCGANHVLILHQITTIIHHFFKFLIFFKICKFILTIQIILDRCRATFRCTITLKVFTQEIFTDEFEMDGIIRFAAFPVLGSPSLIALPMITIGHSSKSLNKRHTLYLIGI